MDISFSSRSKTLQHYNLHKGRESGQWRPGPRLVIHYNLAAVEDGGGRRRGGRFVVGALRPRRNIRLGLRIRVARVVADGLLPLARLPQRVVDVGIVVHEGGRRRAFAVVVAFGLLKSCRSHFVKIRFSQKSDISAG